MDLALQLGYSALGSLLANSVHSPTCLCDCTPTRPDEGVLELLRQQLQRCGPERLTACPAAPPGPPAPPCPGIVGPLAAAFLAGALAGGLLVALLLASRPRRLDPPGQPAPPQPAPPAPPAVAEAPLAIQEPPRAERAPADLAEEARAAVATVRARQAASR